MDKPVYGQLVQYYIGKRWCWGYVESICDDFYLTVREDGGRTCTVFNNTETFELMEGHYEDSKIILVTKNGKPVMAKRKFFGLGGYKPEPGKGYKG